MKIYPSHPLPGVRYEIKAVCPEGGILPFDYRFKLSGYIYQVLNRVDYQLGKVLHDRGFGEEKFKFFVFSDIFVHDGKTKVDREGIHLAPGAIVSFYLSSLLPHFDDRFIYDGILFRSHIRIDDLNLYLDGVVRKDIEFTDTMSFKLISPVFIREPVKRGNKLKYFYILPHTDATLFEDRIAENIRRKVKVFAEIDVNVKVEVDKGYIRRRMKKLAMQGRDPIAYFTKTYHYKGGKIRSVYVPLTISGDVAAISMAYYAGVGHGNALGFGMLEVRE